MAKKPTASTVSKTSTTRKAAAAPKAPKRQAAPSGGAGTTAPVSGMDYPSHEAMFHKFTGLVKWSILSAFVILIFLYVAINPMIRG